MSRHRRTWMLRTLRSFGFRWWIPASVLLALCLAPESFAAAAGKPRLIVVGRESFRSALSGFIAHKQQRMSAEFHSLERILATHSGADDPEKVKRFLYDEWKQRGLTFALLVGDVDVLPVRYMVLDRITPAAFDYSFYPSDFYYSDLARQDGSFDDWNGQKDSFHALYFGEVRGEKNKHDPINYDAVDYRPDIAVGRWPVSTPVEARLVADKTVACERATLAAAPRTSARAAFFAVGGWVDARRKMDRLAHELTNSAAAVEEQGASGPAPHSRAHWQVEKRYYSDPQRPSGTAPPNASEVCSLLNAGLALAVHTGHGEPHRWADSFSMRDLAKITNGNALPIIISAGCSTAYFAPLPPYEPYVDIKGVEHAGSDHKEIFNAPPPPPSPYQSGRFNPTGLGEQLLKRSTNGAVAYIGCNTGSQPCGLTLVDGFVNAVAHGEPTLGEAWSSAIRYYYDKEHLATLQPDPGWYPPSIFFQGMKFMLFGDPSLALPR